MEVQINFVISELNEAEIQTLKDGFSIVSKMILSPDDFKLFKYQPGDSIQVETGQGNRAWCTITDLEVISHQEHVIIIFTLINDTSASGT